MGQQYRGNRNRQQDRNRGSQRGGNRSPAKVTLDEKVITEGGEILVKEAEQLGKQLSKNLTKSQIRNIYGAVKKMQMKGGILANSHTFLMLKPKLAYAAKRHERQSKGLETLRDVLTQAIGYVGNHQGNFNRFVDFFEAILAYHKFYDGK